MRGAFLVRASFCIKFVPTNNNIKCPQHSALQIKRDYPLVQLNGWKLWPLAALINYKFVPLQFRVLFINCVVRMCVRGCAGYAGYGGFIAVLGAEWACFRGLLGWGLPPTAWWVRACEVSQLCLGLQEGCLSNAEGCACLRCLHAPSASSRSVERQYPLNFHAACAMPPTHHRRCAGPSSCC